MKASFLIYFQRDNFLPGILRQKTNIKKPGQRLQNGFTPTVKSIPALLSFILPAPIPLNGILT